MPDVRGGLLARQPRSTLGALERTLNAFSPLGLLNTVVINPLLAGAEAFGRGATTGELSGGDVLAMGAPGMTGGLLAPPGGTALGAGMVRPKFYSRLKEAVAEAPITKAPGSQWLGTLKNTPGVKEEELTWTGFSKWLGQQKGPVTKQEAKDFLRGVEVQISEVLGGKKEPLPKAERTTSPVGMTPMMRDMFTRRMRKVRVEEPISAAEMANVRERARYHWRPLADEIAPHVRGEDFHEGIEPQSVGPTMQLMDRIRSGDEGAVREVAQLLRQPAKEAKKAAEKREIGTRYETYTMPGGKDYRELRLTLPGIEPKYTGGHSFPGPETPNTVAHVRFKDRTDVNGKKTLGIEEIQSDWHEKGRAHGYKVDEQKLSSLAAEHATATPERQLQITDEMNVLHDARRYGVPDAPFKQTEDWAGLALKRMIKWAADHKYDQVTWTPGKVQSDRYKLSQHVDELRYVPPQPHPASGLESPAYFAAYKNGQERVFRSGAEASPEALQVLVGKDVAERLLKSPLQPHIHGNASAHVLSGESMDIGGTGMKDFYDKILVNVANKLGKKHGAKVGVTKIGDQEVWSLPITDAMRDEVTKKGFPLFAGRGLLPVQQQREEPEQTSGLLAERQRDIPTLMRDLTERPPPPTDSGPEMRSYPAGNWARSPIELGVGDALEISAGLLGPGARMLRPSQMRQIMRRPRTPTAPGADLSKRDVENAIISASRSNTPPGELASGAAPDRSGYTLIRHRAKHGDSARFKSLEKRIDAQPAVKAEMMQLARDGEDIGRKWYNTERLRGRFIDVLGEKDGDAAWREYMWLVGTTSSGAKVPANIRMASHYYVQNAQNKLGNIAKELMAGTQMPPEGYGHKMQKTQARNVAKAVTGAWGPHGDPSLNPKPRGFLQSLLGNETNIAADKHFMRLMGMMSDDPQFLHGSAEISQELRRDLRAKYGKKLDKFLFENPIKDAKGRSTKLSCINFNAKKAVREGPKDLYAFIKKDPSVWDDMPNANEYAAFERIANKMAKELGMTGPQFQASLWMGAAKRTKVDPGSLDTFVNLFDKRVKDAAAERGRTPEDVFKRFATRKEPLAIPLGLLGAGTGGLLSQRDRQ